jgi:hypothetical protein
VNTSDLVEIFANRHTISSVNQQWPARKGTRILELAHGRHDQCILDDLSGAVSGKKLRPEAGGRYPIG